MSRTLSTSVVTLHRRIDLGALATLFRLSLRQQAAGRRLWLLAALFLLPAVIGLIIRYADKSIAPIDNELSLILTLFPSALLPFAALWCASGMIQDELEEQTLTYLLIRPLPRWSIYIAKLSAAMIVTALLAGIGCTLAYLAIYGGLDEIRQSHIPTRAAIVAALFALALAAYCSIFGVLSLLTRRSLILGLVYIFILEGVIANIDFIARKITVTYYFKVLIQRWALSAAVEDWCIDLGQSPSAALCVATLVGMTLAGAIFGAAIFSVREFRMKTPEGS